MNKLSKVSVFEIEIVRSAKCHVPLTGKVLHGYKVFKSQALKLQEVKREMP